MSNPVKNNSQLLYEQARQIFEDAREKFEQNSVQLESNFISTVFESFEKFFVTFGEPNFTPRYAPEEGPPWSDDYNQMMKEIKSDLEILFQELDIISKSIYTDFNNNMVQHDILENQYRSVLDKMQDLEAYAGINHRGVQVGRDDFLNKEKIDYSRISGRPLEIVDGAVTLPQIERKNVATDAQVTIITGNRREDNFIIGSESNGFPGNNTEIYSITDSVLTNQNYTSTFIGDDNNHGSYAAVLDGNPNTWFEYEKVNIREHDRTRVAKNLGWEYKVHGNQTIPWAEDPENGILSLHVQVTLSKEEIINQINCNMYTPPNYGAKTAIVKDILISDGKEPPRSVHPKKSETNQYNFRFSPVKAKVISILFEQPYKYVTDVGHVYYEKVGQVNNQIEYALDTAQQRNPNATRVEGPLINLEDIGVDVAVNENSVRTTYPQLRASDSSIVSMNKIVNQLKQNLYLDTVDMGIEKVEGFRWCIGIRDIEIFSCEYATEGELVTYPFYFDEPLNKLSLDINEDIPNLLSNGKEEKYDWLKYYISIDDGAQWHPITPLSREVFSSEQPPKLYTIHTVKDKQLQIDGEKAYIESEFPVYSVRLKVVGYRPDDVQIMTFQTSSSTNQVNNNQVSPILNSYQFHVATKKQYEGSEKSDRILSMPGEIKLEPADPFNPEEEFEEEPSTGNNKSYLLESYLTCVITEWCVDEDLLVPGIVYTTEPLSTVQLKIDNEVFATIDISNYIGTDVIHNDKECKLYEFEFTIPKGSIEPVITYDETPTLSTKRHKISFALYDQRRSEQYGYDFFRNSQNWNRTLFMDCMGYDQEYRPQNCGRRNPFRIIMDKAPKFCICEDVLFIGSAQGPNPIVDITYEINGNIFNPEDFGTPPAEDPCYKEERIRYRDVIEGKSKAESFTTKEMELLEIEDFGEWLDSYEVLNDCGCKNKKKKNLIQAYAYDSSLQDNGFTVQTFSSQRLPNGNYEQSFYVKMPYWKLLELGAKPNEDVQLKITAYDTKNVIAEYESIKPLKDCEMYPECYSLEAIEIHYYDYEIKDINYIIIPRFMSYRYKLENNAGVGVEVSYNSKEGNLLITQKFGEEQTGYSFQIHAVGFHYMDLEKNQQVKWAHSIGETGGIIYNKEKMLGDSERQISWVEDIHNGNYSTAPGLSQMDDYITFEMDEDWKENYCKPDASGGGGSIGAGSGMGLGGNGGPSFGSSVSSDGCYKLTHILFQYYDELDNQLKIIKLDAELDSKEVYDIQTKNGLISIIAGWVGYFEGPAVQIKQSTGDQNLLLTAVGINYLDEKGEVHSAWSEQLRYRTKGTQNAEFVVGEPKHLDDLFWVNNKNVDYINASFLGRQGDMAAYILDSSITSKLCSISNIIDEEIGIDPQNPPDIPNIEFVDAPESMCFEDGILIVEAVVKDSVALSSVTYEIKANGGGIYGPFTDSIKEEELLIDSNGNSSYTINFIIDSDNLEIGDMVELYVKGTNTFNRSSEKSHELFIKNCLPMAKATGDITAQSRITYSIGQDIDMGNFLTEWTEYNQNPNDAGDWTTESAAGRTELTNLKNQGNYSGWYNTIHMNYDDYFFEYKYQARAGDDDVLGSFFRIQRDLEDNIIGFYSVEHDGSGSWVNGSGFRIYKHEVNGTVSTKTLLAEDTTAGWTVNAHRGFMVRVTLKGSDITAELYGESTMERPTGEAPIEPYNWELMTTLNATDNSYPKGAWGPITNSNPESYFWDLRMTGIDEIIIEKQIPINILKTYQSLDQGTYKTLELIATGIGEIFETDITTAIENEGISSSDIVQSIYQITDSSLTDVLNETIPFNELWFEPHVSGSNLQTTDKNSIIKSSIYVDRID